MSIQASKRVLALIENFEYGDHRCLDRTRKENVIDKRYKKHRNVLCLNELVN
jgi:hypothetical protein